MRLYTVSFQLHHNQEYEDLESALESYEDAWNVFDDTWMIRTMDEAPVIRDNLQDHIGRADRMLVVEAKQHWASNNVKDIDWLDKDDA